MPTVVRAKEIEAAAPDSPEFRASIQVIMSNQGRQNKESHKVMDGNNTEILREQRGQ